MSGIDGIGAVEAAFLRKLYDVFNSLKWQIIANTEVIIEDIIEECLTHILSQSFNELVAIITAANSAGGYRFAGSSDLPDAEKKISGSGFIFDSYMYPDLSSRWVRQKKGMGYNGSAVFKGERFKNKKGSSLVGVMGALAKNRELGHQLLQAFGDYRNSSVGTTNTSYLSEYYRKDGPNYLVYAKNAERKRAELERKKRPVA